jgi:hypothetical protein
MIACGSSVLIRAVGPDHNSCGKWGAYHGRVVLWPGPEGVMVAKKPGPRSTPARVGDGL